jgi:predicted lipoprotein with Yx(FWY)xxD motif
MFNRLKTIQFALAAISVAAAGSALANDYYGYGSPPAAQPAKVIVLAALTTGALPPAVKIAGDLLTDKNGMTLYTFDKDAAGSGKSACQADCATSWPPLFAADSAKDTGEFSLVLRNDGRKQWAFKGKPLYLWVGDTKAGETKGDGVGGVWHTAR